LEVAAVSKIIPVKAREIIPLRSIDELCATTLGEWNAMDELIEGARKKVQARRVKIGHILLELQQRIDAGENGELCTFWEWYADMFTRSRGDAERLMTIARDDDPEAAYQRRLEKRKEYDDRYHRKAAGRASISLSPSEMEAEPAAAQLSAPKMEAEPKPLPPKHSRFPEAEGDGAIIEEIVALYQRLSWGGRDKAATRILALYNEWKRGG
jgi:hypothetical protein